MNRFFYTLLIYLATPIILCYLAYRAYRSSDYRGRIGERFALSPLKPTKPAILIHSVSVGETIAATPLINQIIKRYPDYQVVVTTSTPTGSATVKKAFSDRVMHCYLPLDLPGSMSRFLEQLKPELCIIMETELWPNLIHQLDKRHIPTLLANARMSQKSATGYLKKAKPLMAEMLNKLDQVSAQFDSDGQRFIELGLPAEQLKVSGSIKFDLTISDELIEQQRQLKQQWASERPVWLAGSTHPIEDQQLLACHQQLLTQFPNLLLIIVPRHPERFDDVAQHCQNTRFDFVRRSQGIAPLATTQVVVGDTMGELLLFCGVSDVAFIGGSLIERGGHNPLEPAALGVPVLMGPHVYNFSDISERLVTAQGMQQVSDSDELTQRLTELFSDQDQLDCMGRNAKALVQENQGTLERLLSWVDKKLTRT
ncbi:lipid IV(A) 3-deoxy-D-manno-octulosonic acid transferase [Psychrobium sp. 1_MG-2023]|uniref:lipid IV(A) 3-deoxy-D-manno-octulosonic acid transferase n=1 Tax=Psychrobium sp. 1_MG-2023 TaxID=3062624 RepID=UPI000C323D29|nr:lipid IV(A) 3-deoxy-D-manno-octulosonic acid transferase [Psychrobium sp. 1_MG-2023]MDP2562530.1 lipid IV(A) 3-deoxy-D-manno-octulosonic acid transferase [Psychrobium sp. 1_MG-2023]PKF57978.1 3-deoxy-D-manno-octulosonic acid transferase [Alteromonadales bacterium alter-6D02]